MSFDLPPLWAAPCLDYIGFEDVLLDYFSSIENDSSGEPRLALDEKPYTYWQPDSGDATKEFTVILSEARDCDYLALYHFAIDGGTLEVSTSTTLAAAFVSLVTISDDAGGKPYMLRFAERSVRRVKFNFTTAGDDARIAVAMMGRFMSIPKQNEGWTPPRLARRVERTANVSNAGQFLGSSILRAANKFDIQATFLNLEWAYDVWLQFIRHAESRPFFFEWDIAEGGDVVFCWVEDEIPAPTFVTNVALDAIVPVVGVVE